MSLSANTAASLYPLGLGLLAAVALIQSLRLWWSRAAPAMRARARQRRGARGEREAEAFLKRAGYALLERQPVAVIDYGLGPETTRVTVRGDLLVRRAGRRYLAEVKTGALAPRLSHRETRRQLLEYAHAFEVDGLLLVDADQGLVDEVRLPARRAGGAAPRGALGALVPALLLGAALGALGAAWALGAAG